MAITLTNSLTTFDNICARRPLALEQVFVEISIHEICSPTDSANTIPTSGACGLCLESA